MARAGFGGSGDYSGLFGSLYSSTKDLARQQKDADDQDALDRWSNGLMTDEEWVAYIRQRINEEAGDPKRQQKWVTALRKYEPAIADEQAQQAYEQGGSINDLIAHYEQRLSVLEPNSNGYREVQDRLNDAMDKRASDNISTGAEKIVDRINKGKASYEDLLKFLKTSKAQTRPNSRLFESLGEQISQVQDTIRVNDTEGDLQEAQYKFDRGKMSASAFAALIRRKAALFKTSDPKRYYQMLGAASDLAGSGGGSGGGGGGGSYRSSSSRSGGGLSDYEKLNKRVDSLQAQRNALEAMVKQYEENPQAPVVDPRTGKATVLSPAAVKAIDSQLVQTWDAMTAAYKQKGDKSAAANTQKTKAAYISTHVVEHNTMPAIEQSQNLISSVNGMLDDALQDPDPQHAMTNVKAAASMVNNWVKSLQTKKTVQTGGPDREIDAGKTEVTARGPMDLVDPALIARATTLGSALSVLSDENADDASAAAALDSIRQLEGSSPGNTGEGVLVGLAKKALQVNGTRQGLQNGDLERVITTGGIAYLPKVTAAVSAVVNGSVTTVLQKVVDDSSMISDRKSQKMVDVFIDINGQPTKVKAVASMTAPAGAMAWYAKSNIKLDGGKVVIMAGQPIPSAIVDKYADSIGSKATLKPAFEYLQVQVPAYSDSAGNHPAEAWSQDPETQLWYKGGLPIRNIQYNPDGTVAISAEGIAQYDYKAYASAGGVTSPYAGRNAKAMQDIANQGLAGKPSGTRDITGRYNPDGTYDSARSYYNPTFMGRDLTQEDSWWNEEAQSRKAEAEAEAFRVRVRAESAAARAKRDEDIRKVLSPEGYQKWKADQAIKASPVGAILGMFGISTGTKPEEKKASLRLPTGNRNLDGFDPTATKKVPGAASGPNLSEATGFSLDIKKSSVTKIDTSSVKKTTTPNKKGTTTKSAAPKVTVKPKAKAPVQNTATTSSALDKLRQSTGGGR